MGEDSSDGAVSSATLTLLDLLVSGDADGGHVVSDVGDEREDAGEGIH